MEMRSPQIHPLAHPSVRKFVEKQTKHVSMTGSVVACSRARVIADTIWGVTEAMACANSTTEALLQGNLSGFL